MTYEFYPMTQQQAEEITHHWHYDGKYCFYDMESDQEDLEEFLDPKQRGENYYVVTSEKALVGFFSYHPVDPETIDIGLGIKPSLTGEGRGREFVEAGLNFAKKSFNPSQITLSVATFNQRAIKVYEKAGFVRGETFMQNTNGSSYEFLKMNYKPERKSVNE
ncbi:GNAT family N-acetyltransferase [Thalassobacillus devorans]|uniref:GNAT family N-acetyltransferase n=1 Tax=Thalassobacillus devorans TaxID=279813 RepID=UPI00048ED01D|nr:GNAT family protein [Thalassobacillus devorans]